MLASWNQEHARGPDDRLPMTDDQETRRKALIGHGPFGHRSWGMRSLAIGHASKGSQAQQNSVGAQGSRRGRSSPSPSRSYAQAYRKRRWRATPGSSRHSARRCLNVDRDNTARTGIAIGWVGTGRRVPDRCGMYWFGQRIACILSRMGPHENALCAEGIVPRSEVAAPCRHPYA